MKESYKDGAKWGKETICKKINEEDEHKLKDNWKKYGMKKDIGFIGYTNVFHFPNEKKPKWCPKE